jgi:tetratricopeptide (TPR) repeat protein
MMDSEFEFDDSQNINNLIDRFEEHLSSNGSVFFDTDEWEDILDYYDMVHDLKHMEFALETAMNVYPNHPYFKLKKALLLSSKGESGKGLSLLKDILEEDGEYTDALEAMALIYSQNEQHTKSIDIYLKIIEQGGSRIDNLMNIAMEYQELGKYAIALRYLKRTLKMDPEYTSALYEILHCYESLLDMESAISFFQSYIEEHPYSDTAWFNLGICYSNHHLFDKAVEAYDFVLSIDASYSSALFNKGNALMNLGRFEEAIHCFEETFDLEFEDSLTHLYMGKCYENLENTKQARIHYMRSLELNKHQFEAKIGMALILHQEGKNLEALSYLENDLNQSRYNFEYIMTYTGLLIELERYEEACEILSRALEDDLKEVDIYYFLAEMLLILERGDEAYQRIVLDKKPKEVEEHPKLILKMADILVHVKMPKEAQAQLSLIGIDSLEYFHFLMENPNELDIFLERYETDQNK